MKKYILKYIFSGPQQYYAGYHCASLAISFDKNQAEKMSKVRAVKILDWLNKPVNQWMMEEVDNI